MFEIRKKKVKALQKIPLPKQRSPEWFAMRNRMITASALADAIGQSKYKAPLEFVVEKCGYPSYQDGPATHHGKKFENIITLIYSERNNVEVLEFGVLPHPNHDFLGASPDGICSHRTLNGEGTSDMVGRMVEIKCPLSRVIKTDGAIDGDICPHYYYLQVQMQLDVCDLDECDFIQCKISEYANRTEFIEDTSEDKITSATTGLERGCILQFIPKSKLGCDNCIYKAKYIYPPSASMTLRHINEFIASTLDGFIEDEFPDIKYDYDNNGKVTDEYIFDKVIYWKVDFMSITLIKKEPEWLKTVLHDLRRTWKCVLFYRSDKEKLLELKRIYDRYQTKFADKKLLVKHSLQIMEEYMSTNLELDTIIDKYFCKPVDKPVDKPMSKIKPKIDNDAEYNLKTMKKKPNPFLD